MTHATRRLLRSSGAAALVLAATAAPAHAQSLWLDREARTSVRVERRIPSPPDVENGGYAASLTVRAPIHRAAWIVVEAPFARLAGPETFISPDFGDWTTRSALTPYRSRSARGTRSTSSTRPTCASRARMPTSASG